MVLLQEAFGKQILIMSDASGTTLSINNRNRLKGRCLSIRQGIRIGEDRSRPTSAVGRGC